MIAPPAILSQKILFRGWSTLSHFEIGIANAKGEIESHAREIADHGHAASVLLLNSGSGRITLVRQFRLPAQLNGDDGFMLEACAGLLDGDDPESCARREAVEETGIAPQTLVHAFDLYASPGSLTEKVSCFVGHYSDQDRVGRGGGLPDEGEEIEIVEIGFADALPMIASEEIIDAKTVALIQHAALNGLLQRSDRS